ncbi:hypothetical protein [Sphingomonas sp. Leaf343]|uniref:hypothetical protein n=1 Tax=Sphingomonas sp. Leaf343 TaxID=1736345 RepID=UPI000ACE3EE5|nr:hypothetical protein [Sphingomonas sp. Leaf343]
MRQRCSVAGIGEHARQVRAEADKMRAAVEGHGRDAKVTMTALQFRLLADMMTQLADAASGCGGEECMGAEVDGFRFWVAKSPLGHPQGNA